MTAEADVAVLFLHNEGYSTMCGHGVIALVTTLLETAPIASQGQHTFVTLDTTAGDEGKSGISNRAIQLLRHPVQCIKHCCGLREGVGYEYAR